MAMRYPPNPSPLAQPGSLLLVVHDFAARSPDELSLAKGDRIELIERDDDFGDGWFLGRHMQNGNTGLFPEVYTTPAPRGTFTPVANQQRSVPHAATNQTSPVNGQSGRRSSSASATSQVVQPTPTTAQLVNTRLSYASDNVRSSYISDNARPVSFMAAPQSTPSQRPMAAFRTSVPSAAQRSLTMTSSNGDSPVMNETLSVIDEHITDMHTPRHSLLAPERRGTNDSSSEYSSQLGNRLSYINGQETDEEEHNLHTEEEVLRWSPDRVAEYLEDVGVERRHCEVFREQEISGEVLLAMDQSSIFIKEFDLGPVGRRLKTWQKVRSLQDEVRRTSLSIPRSVSDYSGVGGDDSASDVGRNRSSSTGTVLPRIPTMTDKPGSRAQSSQDGMSNSSFQSSVPKGTSPLANVVPPSQMETSRRPSAASVRNMNHSRRHSSIDRISNSPTGYTAPNVAALPSLQSHRKQPSIDENWNLGSLQTTVNGRPASSAHAYTMSSGGTRYDTSSRDLGLGVVDLEDVDKGYFSGGEIGNRKNRNVLHKKGNVTPANPSHFTTETRRRSTVQQTTDQITESNDATSYSTTPMVSPAAEHYYGTSHKNGSMRTSSTPDFANKPLRTATGVASPTVTKPEYGEDRSINAIPTSPNVADIGSPSLAPASPSSGMQPSFSSKSRITGLRAISDAVTGAEKSYVSIPVDRVPSPVKESPMQSPTRTGSTTPSTTSQSFDFGKAEATARASGGSTGGLTPVSATSTTASRRAKSKKTTSAYTRGLEKKPPKEQMIGCDYSGWMKKKSSNLMTTWKPRLFVLRGRRLSYYYSENDREEKGLIDISSHRVLPADTEKLTGLHATLTGATSSPTSPLATTTSLPTAASLDVASQPAPKGDATGLFIFKLVPPRTGMTKGVNFTKPAVHYFAVDNVQQGRLWMAALMKATIDRDAGGDVKTTYNQKTVSLEKAQAMRQRPPALRDVDEGSVKEKKEGEERRDRDGKGLGIGGLGVDKDVGEGAERVNGHGSIDGEAGMPEAAASVPLPDSNTASTNGVIDKSVGLS
ncbi:polarized growth protein Boi2 [Cryomyces antarcticus]